MRSVKEISVCICTYKRPELLRHLLERIRNQQTGGLFDFSIVVVDNDRQGSAKCIVTDFRSDTGVNVVYSVEPRQNIALARNRTLELAKGDYVAFIDDDELPPSTWLLSLFRSCNDLMVDGVLGPVQPSFAVKPPNWIWKSKMFERPSHDTGFRLKWENTRTGNALLRLEVLRDEGNRFRKQFGSGGEDRDLFRRLIEKGYTFAWCNEAPVFEIIPKERWKTSVMLKRALLRGQSAINHPSLKKVGIIKALIAILLYSLALPFLAARHHLFMKYLIKCCDHVGLVTAACGFAIIRQKYI